LEYLILFQGSIQTDGHTLKVLFFNANKKKVGDKEAASQLRAYSLSNLLEGIPNYGTKFTNQETRGLELIKDLKAREDVKLSVFGADPGDRFGLGASALREDESIAYFNLSKNSYFKQSAAHYESTLRTVKALEENGNVQVLEDSINAASSQDPLKARMDADLELNSFYSQECLLEGKRRNRLLKRKWLDLALKSILDPVDMTIHTHSKE